ncbi:MAG TPA: hypothetical protein VNM72_12220, partial [Blastocatellia bacterium]|nr:hypothetical protein [Blastocatellia bacterium]
MWKLSKYMGIVVVLSLAGMMDHACRRKSVQAATIKAQTVSQSASPQTTAPETKTKHKKKKAEKHAPSQAVESGPTITPSKGKKRPSSE